MSPTENTSEMSGREMAIDAIKHRVARQYIGQPENVLQTAGKRTFDQAVAIFDEAVKRLGEAQAVADATSGAIGLPVDPVARQAEIERRRRENDAAASMQMGNGEQYAILEGRMQTGLHEQVGDPTRPELQPLARPGNGDRVNRQIDAVRMGLIDPKTGEGFDTPQQNLMAAQQNPGTSGNTQETSLRPQQEQQHRELLARTKDLQAQHRPAA